MVLRTCMLAIQLAHLVWRCFVILAGSSQSLNDMLTHRLRGLGTSRKESVGIVLQLSCNCHSISVKLFFAKLGTVVYSSRHGSNRHQTFLNHISDDLQWVLVREKVISFKLTMVLWRPIDTNEIPRGRAVFRKTHTFFAHFQPVQVAT